MTELLPGVSPIAPPPAVVADSRGAVKRARRRAILTDVLDVALLAAVDFLFLTWPTTHVPLLDRNDSLVFLGVVNVVLIGYLWLSRAIPRWSARRVASTWSLAERARFFAADRREQPRQH